MAILLCINCGKKYKTYRLTDHGRKRRYCSYACWSGSPVNTIKKRGNKNVSKRLDVRKKMSLAKIGIVGERHMSWRGHRAGYGAIHSWMARNRKKPKSCEHCGKAPPAVKRIEWANVTGKYDRLDKKDWLGLCTKCHAKFDGRTGPRVLS